jgi:hypothetical protein
VGIELYDLSGRRVLAAECRRSGDGRATASIDLSGLPSGTYLLAARTARLMTSSKLVVLSR